jgi:uncharacterized Zn finger protein
MDRHRTLATVAGSDDYRTEVSGHGDDIGGACSCPAFADRGFCKHMVATALAANALSADRGGGATSPLDRIRKHLRDQGVEALVEIIVDLATRDAALLRSLDIAAAASLGDESFVEARLTKAVNEATAAHYYIGYREASDWADGVKTVLDAIAGIASGRHAAAAARLAELAIDRVEAAIESIDDSDGHCGYLLEQAQAIHLTASRSARPEPIALARDLFTRETEGDYDTFGRAAELYADVLGADGLAEYRRLATEAWDALPTRTGRNGQSSVSGLAYYRLVEILDFFAEREGAVEARITLRTKDLSSTGSYVGLAQFCLDHGREEEGLRYAEEGLWVFEDERVDERLVLLAAKLLTKAERGADAEAHLWRAFEKAPSLKLYEELRKAGGEEAKVRAVGFIEGRVAGAERTLWHAPADILVRILIHEKDFDAAWSRATRYGISADLAQTLARTTEETHPREALATYAERVEALVSAANNGTYAEAAKLIARMASLHDAAAHARYLAEVKARHGRKRNLMKLLG